MTGREATGRWTAARRVLCVRLDTIGDVLMTTPAIRALRGSLAGRRISLLTSPAGAEVAGLVPEIGDVLVYEAPWMKTDGPAVGSPADAAALAAVREGRFDAAVILTVFTQSALPAALFCFQAGIPLRLAYARENPYRLLTDWVRETEPEREVRHEVRRQLDLVASIGCVTEDRRLSLRVPPEADRRVEELLGTEGVTGERWVVLHPGASAPSRTYRPEGFAEAGRRLAAEDAYRIVLTGSADERPLADHVRGAIGPAAVSLAGRLDVGELAALIRRAPLVICGNTGPVHVAAAVGTPVVDVYALTNPQHTPWGVPNRVLFHDVPCRYCYRSVCPEGHHNCLALVEPDDIVRAARELLGIVPPSGGRTPLPVLSGARPAGPPVA